MITPIAFNVVLENSNKVQGMALFKSDGGTVQFDTKNDFSKKSDFSFNASGVEDHANFLCSFLLRHNKNIIGVEINGVMTDVVKREPNTGINKYYKIGNIVTTSPTVYVTVDGVVHTVDSSSIASSVIERPDRYCKDENINAFLVRNNVPLEYTNGLVARLKEFMKGYSTLEQAASAKSIKYIRISKANNKAFITTYRKKPTTNVKLLLEV